MIDVSSFEEDPALAEGLELLLVVKRTDQLERDARTSRRIEESGRDAAGFRRGSERSDRYHEGFVGSYVVDDIVLEEKVSRFSTRQPSGALILNDRIYVGSGDRIDVLDPDLNRLDSISDPWFARVHSIARSDSRLLVVSSAYDLLLERSLSLEPIRDFSLWDYGYDTNHEGETFARDVEGRSADHVIPEAYRNGLGVPTALVPNHVNGAEYAPDGDSIIASLLHPGELVRLTRGKSVEPIISGLVNPHLSGRTMSGEYIVADTGRDRILFYDARSDGISRTVSVADVAPKLEHVRHERWLQNASQLDRSLFLAVDSPARSLIFFDLEERSRRTIRYPVAWAMQAALPFNRYATSR